MSLFSMFDTSSKCALPTKAKVKEIINGCQNECDKKCVIDNHEVEILHSPGEFGSTQMESMQCPSGRVADLCAPGRPRVVSTPRMNSLDSTSARAYRPEFRIPRSDSGLAGMQA